MFLFGTVDVLPTQNNVRVKVELQSTIIVYRVQGNIKAKRHRTERKKNLS